MSGRVLSSLSSALRQSLGNVRHFFGQKENRTQATKGPRFGLGFSGGLLITAGLLLLLAEPRLVLAIAPVLGLLIFGVAVLAIATRKSLTLYRSNFLSFAATLTAVVALYMITSRLLIVGYTTDTVVGTYMGVLRVLQFQSPYDYSIKPLLDSFGFSPAFYTPGVNGSFDFHFAYPALSFLAVMPLYLIGLHDVRDIVFVFYLASLLLVFGLAPSRFKNLSLIPFGLFPIVIAGSWTDSIWAFFLVLTAYFWYKRPKASWISLGLAVAVKQIAIVAAPFLLVRLWRETPVGRARAMASGIGLMLAAFFIPNLPFIIASPGGWWNGIVAPYLPNSPAQVPGGLGFSEILLRLGVALPSGFFLALMIGTGTFLTYTYAKHYRGLNSMLFAFPILLFFFYYRSFPNYMTYWVFPLVIELTRLGGPNLRLLKSIRLPTISWRPSTGTFLRITRLRVTPSIMIVMAVTLAFMGVSGAYISQVAKPKAAILVNSVADPDSIGAVTVINVTLTNLHTTPVSPTFFVKWFLLTYLWNSNSTVLLNPGSQKTYAITAPDALSAVPAGSTFHVLIYDRLTNQLLGESTGYKADTVVPPLSNPTLKWWVLDSSVGKRVPFDWKLSTVNTDLLSSRITPLGYNGTAGVQMVLNSTLSSPGISRLTFSQRILFNATRVSLHFNQSFTTRQGGTVFGASVSDGTHTLYYMFSNGVTQQTTAIFSSNTTITVPISGSQWNTVLIDPASIWSTQQWTFPTQATLSLFLESPVLGVFSASFDQISPQ